MSKSKISTKTIESMAKLSQLQVDKEERRYFTRQFIETIATVDQLTSLNTTEVEGTSHVTGLSNVFREDIVDNDRMLSQKEALSNSKRNHKGYFVVKAVFDE